MKFTSEDLLKAMGLKVGNVVKLENFKNQEMKIIRDENGEIILKELHSIWSDAWVISNLMNNEVAIIKPKPTLTEDEKVILKNINKEYRWIARNESKDCVSVFSDFPTRSSFVWDYCDAMWNLPFNHLFQFIKWEDEPYEIKELLK